MFPCHTYFVQPSAIIEIQWKAFFNIVRNKWGSKGKKIVMPRLMKTINMKSNGKKNPRILFSVYSKKYHILVLHFLKISKPKHIQQL